MRAGGHGQAARPGRVSYTGDVDHGAAATQRLRQHGARLAGPRQEHARARRRRDRRVERVEQPSATYSSGTTPTGEAALLERPRRRRADGRHPHPGAAPPPEPKLARRSQNRRDGVGAREDDECRRRRARARPRARTRRQAARHDADGRARAAPRAPSARVASTSAAAWLARPRDDHRAPGAGPRQASPGAASPPAGDCGAVTRRSPASRRARSAGQDAPGAGRAAGARRALRRAPPASSAAQQLVAHGLARRRASLRRRAGASVARRARSPLGAAASSAWPRSVPGSHPRGARSRARSARTARALGPVARPATSAPTRASPALRLDGQRALPHGRQHLRRRRRRRPADLGLPRRERPAAARTVPAMACSSSLRSRVCTLPRMSTSSQIGAQRQELRAAPQARAAHARRAAGQGAAGAPRGAAPGSGHEHVAHVLARGEGHRARGRRARAVGMSLAECTARSMRPSQHRRLELLGEQALVADLGQRRVEQPVALGVDDHDLTARLGVQRAAAGRAPTRSARVRACCRGSLCAGPGARRRCPLDVAPLDEHRPPCRRAPPAARPARCGPRRAPGRAGRRAPSRPSRPVRRGRGGRRVGAGRRPTAPPAPRSRRRGRTACARASTYEVALVAPGDLLHAHRGHVQDLVDDAVVSSSTWARCSSVRSASLPPRRSSSLRGSHPRLRAAWRWWAPPRRPRSHSFMLSELLGDDALGVDASFSRS